jgi:ADP-ribosyl-[dinitrogen reductase] hydrolase
LDKQQVGRGSILGALVGDAAGATLEFIPQTPTRSQVKQAMAMVGGGTWRTAPGQITDDGEMALCLMHALAGENSFSIERVAQSYLLWYQSIPFDIGRTTSSGLSGGLKQPDGLIYRGMWRAAEQHNMGSKANGGLMRIAPLGVWGWRVSEEKLVHAVCQDNLLTHPNPTCQYSSAVYCIAIRHLMLNPKDSEGAIQAAVEWAETLGNREVQGWLLLAEQNKDVGYSPSIGFVKYGFIHAFRHLKDNTSYIDAIFETLSGGGDTDTNACIVGGLVGAYHGERGIPEPMREAVLRCDTQKGRSRPEFLQTRVQFPGLLDRLIG